MPVTLIGDPGGAIEPETTPFGDFFIYARPMPQPRPQARVINQVRRILEGWKVILATRDPATVGRGLVDRRIDEILAAEKAGFMQMYYPDTKGKEHKTWKQAIWDAAKIILPANEIDRGVKLTVNFYIQRPQKLMGKKYPDGPIIHIARGDLDNFEKAVMDALSPKKETKSQRARRGLWKDDALVCLNAGAKYYAAKTGPMGAYVRIDIVRDTEELNDAT